MIGNTKNLVLSCSVSICVFRIQFFLVERCLADLQYKAFCRSRDAELYVEVNLINCQLTMNVQMSMPRSKQGQMKSMTIPGECPLEHQKHIIIGRKTHFQKHKNETADPQQAQRLFNVLVEMNQNLVQNRDSRRRWTLKLQHCKAKSTFN